MLNDPRYSRRIRSRDVRHSLAPEEEARGDAAEEDDPAVEPAGEPARQQEPRPEPASSASERRVPSGANSPAYSPTSPASSSAGERGGGEDRGNDLEPRGVARERVDDEPNGRNTRRRTEEARGVRREREEPEDDPAEPQSSRQRVGAINQILKDVISIHNDYMRKHHLAPNQICSREIARAMIDDLDRKHARRMEQWK